MNLNFFQKMEKNNAVMDVTCKFNTYLEKAFFRFLAILCGFSFKVYKKWLKGIFQPFELGGETGLIRFDVKY